jgi:hypothetical protein
MRRDPQSSAALETCVAFVIFSQKTYTHFTDCASSPSKILTKSACGILAVQAFNGPNLPKIKDLFFYSYNFLAILPIHAFTERISLHSENSFMIKPR